MRRNCNLELRLPPTTAACFVSSDYGSSSPSILRLNKLSEAPKQEQQLTIFYNGQIAVCDVTELQARAIILLASRETEKSRTPPASPLLQSPLYSPTAGLSMKRSLQRFLQKRKNRNQATSPYYHD
ncbi:hypothetical protein ACH5RR_015457 [Cinchona calisaya]|uniref:Protein TIFY n=1 Tax=Cinchona calisaya TaxID=153742 RepID=A0ABD2ZUG0_9GENT